MSYRPRGEWRLVLVHNGTAGVDGRGTEPLLNAFLRRFDKKESGCQRLLLIDVGKEGIDRPTYAALPLPRWQLRLTDQAATFPALCRGFEPDLVVWLNDRMVIDKPGNPGARTVSVSNELPPAAWASLPGHRETWWTLSVYFRAANVNADPRTRPIIAQCHVALDLGEPFGAIEALDRKKRLEFYPLVVEEILYRGITWDGEDPRSLKVPPDFRRSLVYHSPSRATCQ